MTPDLRAITAEFDIRGDFVSSCPYGSGHINNTYAVAFDQGGRPARYILQRINRNVFPDVLGLMENIERACSHTKTSLAVQNSPDISRRTLTVVPARDGNSCFVDDNGGSQREVGTQCGPRLRRVPVFARRPPREKAKRDDT